MSDLNNKHLPSDIDSLTRKDLVEIYHIHAEEFQKLQQANNEAQSLIGLLEAEVGKLKQERDSLYVILKGKNNDIDMLTSVLSDVYQSGVSLGENEIQVRNALVSHDYQSSELNK